MTKLQSTDPPASGNENGGLARLLARREMELAAAQRMSEVFSQQIKLQDLMAQALQNCPRCRRCREWIDPPCRSGGTAIGVLSFHRQPACPVRNGRSLG